jgi:hypothetical protein
MNKGFFAIYIYIFLFLFFLKKKICLNCIKGNKFLNCASLIK